MQKSPIQNLEQFIKNLDKKIDELKIQYNLFFSGEINIPPEKDRTDIENQIRGLLSTEQKTAVINILIQNVASKFSIYNNVWLKRLHEFEIGTSPQFVKKAEQNSSQGRVESKEKEIPVSLNREESFERFFSEYQSLCPASSKKSSDKEAVINLLKSKMITENLIDAQVYLTLAGGKVKIRVKK